MKDQKEKALRQQPWNIVQLSRQLPEDLEQCHTQIERDNCKALFRLELITLGKRIISGGRKFTPGEISVLKSHHVYHRVMGTAAPA